MPFNDQTIHLFAPKGGQGCTTVAACLALYTAERAGDITVYDAAPHPELAAVYGLTDESPLAVNDRVTAYRYDNEHDTPSLPVADIVDWGTRPVPGELPGQRVIVIAPCYLALNLASRLPDHQRPDAAIVVIETGRAFGPSDVEATLGVKTLATVRRDPTVARSIDAGLLATRTPPAAMQGLHSMVPDPTASQAVRRYHRDRAITRYPHDAQQRARAHRDRHLDRDAGPTLS